jgi:hypothetical protein
MDAIEVPPSPTVRARAPKAVCEGYAPGPFFFAERRGDVVRLVAWTGDVAQLRRLVDAVLDRFPARVRVALTIRSEQATDGWLRYDGDCELATVRAALAAHEEAALQDGDAQLTVETETGERLTLDDVGVLYLPSASAELEQACVATGFAKRREELIGRGGGWRRTVAGDVRHRLIGALRLELMRGGDEPPIDEERRLRHQRAVRFASVLWGTVGGLLFGLGTNDAVRGVRGRGIGVLAAVAIAAGAMLILAGVRGGLAQIRGDRRKKSS